MTRRAVILAGGKGSRLKPYTVVLPKPLVPVGDYPILEIIVRQLAYYGFSHITMAVNHHAELIKAFFGDGRKWRVKIDYSMEEKPLGTMAPLKLIKNLPENFLIMNGDVLTDLKFSSFHDYHVKHKLPFTISGYKRTVTNEFGILKANDKNQLVGFEEKPSQTYCVSMGIYMANCSILDYIPNDRYFGFDHLMHEMIRFKALPGVKPFDGRWLDIGRPDDYADAVEEFEKHKSLFLVDEIKSSKKKFSF
jgi:NDP-sugar pyrophosphorylase family protein